MPARNAKRPAASTSKKPSSKKSAPKKAPLKKPAAKKPTAKKTAKAAAAAPAKTRKPADIASSVNPDTHTLLPRDSNQALGIARFAIDFIRGKGTPDPAVLERTNLFHVDAVFCGLSAIALNTNAPRVLREEAMDYGDADNKEGATLFGSRVRCAPEKAVVANSAAVREWDSNGTNFGFNPSLGHTAGEFGHNDFYPVAMAAAQMRNLDGAAALRGMILLDEIRGRLAEVFSLKSYKIDHVVHGAIASAATFGAMMGATAEQIESAIGMVVAHYIPWRAIRAGKQLSDSKGASAAISSEVAVLSVLRSMRGFLGPRDIFRNPEAIFRFFEPTTSGAERWKEHADSPFDLALAHSGPDFAVMGMHFKLGLYEHQSAGAIQGVIDLLANSPALLDDPAGDDIKNITIVAYEPAYGIIGNPAKKDPRTRQSADHSMAYIIATLIRKAIEHRKRKDAFPIPNAGASNAAVWKALMLSPYDYAEDERAIFHPLTRKLMDKISFEHGGPKYDRLYPDGIPTSVRITDSGNKKHDSGLVMYPAGHARNTTANLRDILNHKFTLLGSLASSDPASLITRYDRLERKSAKDISDINNFELAARSDFR